MLKDAEVDNNNWAEFKLKPVVGPTFRVSHGLNEPV